MTTSATTEPRASVDHVSAEALRGQIQTLMHAMRHAIAGLGYVADDPCQPAQRALLTEIRDDLRDALDKVQP